MTFPIVAYLNGIPLRGVCDPSAPVTKLSPRFTELVEIEFVMKTRGEEKYISVMAPLSLASGRTRFKRRAEFSFTDDRFLDKTIDVVIGGDLLRRAGRPPKHLPSNVVRLSDRTGGGRPVAADAAP